MYLKMIKNFIFLQKYNGAAYNTTYAYGFVYAYVSRNIRIRAYENVTNTLRLL